MLIVYHIFYYCIYLSLHMKNYEPYCFIWICFVNTKVFLSLTKGSNTNSCINISDFL